VIVRVTLGHVENFHIRQQTCDIVRQGRRLADWLEAVEMPLRANCLGKEFRVSPYRGSHVDNRISLRNQALS